MNVSQKFNGSKTDLFAVECNLPIPPINLGNYQVEGTPAARYFISVSNDGSYESEPVQMITFDSVCQVCNVSNGCSLKVRQKKINHIQYRILPLTRPRPRWMNIT